MLALLAIIALRTLVTPRWALFRPLRWPARLAFGRGPSGSRWPFATSPWIVLPWLVGSGGAVLGLTHAGRIALDRAGALEASAARAVFLLAWILGG